jgi:competence protein ComEC
MNKYLIVFLTLIACLVWLAVFSVDDRLHIVACDVGQGDAVLVQRNSDQILIDGGPDGKVLDCLGRHMPFFDRKIELVILTHPDSDHSAGIVQVFKTYRVESIMTNDLSNPKFGTEVVQALRTEVGSEGSLVIYPYNLPTIRLGMIYLDVVHPSRDFSDSKTNNYSIVTVLRYNNFEALLTGDIEDGVSDLVSESPRIPDVDYIKIPHHGSKNGLSEKLLQISKPETAIISVSTKNSYGHPHQEVLDLLKKYGVEVLRTDQMGDVILLK